MEEHFNGLTPAEAERLSLMIEEMSECIQIMCKILRHGYESYNPVSGDFRTNRELMMEEMGHVRAAGLMMDAAGDIEMGSISMSSDEKLVSVQRWLHHQTSPPEVKR